MFGCSQTQFVVNILILLSLFHVCKLEESLSPVQEDVATDHSRTNNDGDRETHSDIVLTSTVEDESTPDNLFYEHSVASEVDTSVKDQIEEGQTSSSDHSAGEGLVESDVESDGIAEDSPAKEPNVDENSAGLDKKVENVVQEDAGSVDFYGDEDSEGNNDGDYEVDFTDIVSDVDGTATNNNIVISQTDEAIHGSSRGVISKDNSTLFSLQDIINTVMTPDLNDNSISKIEAVSQSAGNASEFNSSVSANATAQNETANADKNKFKCIGRNVTENVTALVKIANSTELIQALSFKDVNISGNCALVMFYAPWCMFCARTAPNFNAVARAFPQLQVLAVDAVHFNSLNARFGTVSVPNILLFHNSRAVVRFNQTTRSFQTLVEFVHKYTGLKPNTTIDVSDADIRGPLPSVPSDDPDKWLFVCWLFIIAFSGWLFSNSETGQNLWRTLISFGHEHVHID